MPADELMLDPTELLLDVLVWRKIWLRLGWDGFELVELDRRRWPVRSPVADPRPDAPVPCRTSSWCAAPPKRRRRSRRLFESSVGEAAADVDAGDVAVWRNA